MNPYPFSGLNHFTKPIATFTISNSAQTRASMSADGRRRDRRGLAPSAPTMSPASSRLLQALSQTCDFHWSCPPTTRPENRRPTRISVWARPFCNKSPRGLRTACSCPETPNTATAIIDALSHVWTPSPAQCTLRGTAWPISSARCCACGPRFVKISDWSRTHLNPRTSSSNRKSEGFTAHIHLRFAEITSGCRRRPEVLEFTMTGS